MFAGETTIIPPFLLENKHFPPNKNHFAHETYVLTKEQLKTRNRPGEASVEGLLEATKT
jgi:hypothetical protein